MDNEQRNAMDDLLGRATEALRDTVVPDGPPDEVVARTLAALQAGPAKGVYAKRMIMRALLKVAAVLIVVVALACLLMRGGGVTNLAMADVVEALRNIQSARYATTMTMHIPGQPPQKVEMQVLMAADGWMRVEGPDGVASISDLHQQKMLMLNPRQKSATIVDMAKLPKEKLPANPIDRLREMDIKAQKDAKPLGRKEVDGHQTEGFEFNQEEGTLEVWVDVETRLPVKTRITGPKNDVIVGAETLSRDFVWNPPVDRSLLSLTPPPGYQLANLKWDISPATEKDLVASLSLLAELNQGQFPDEYGMASLQPILDSLEHRKNALTQAEKSEWSQKMMTITRGFVFVGIPGQGTDWHYAGKGVALNTPNRPVLWYKPKGSANYRVINADLSEQESSADQLPTVPSVALPVATP